MRTKIGPTRGRCLLGGLLISVLGCQDVESTGDVCAQANETEFFEGDGAYTEEQPAPTGWAQVTRNELIALAELPAAERSDMFVMFSRDGMFVRRAPGYEVTDWASEADPEPAQDLVLRSNVTDNRQPVTNLEVLGAYPTRSVGRVELRVPVIYGNGSTGTLESNGTGTMVGPRHVLTAAHVMEREGVTGSSVPETVAAFQGLWDEHGGYIWFRPGYHPDLPGDEEQPNGQGRAVVDVIFHMDWLADHFGGNDIAIMILEDREETAALKWWGMCTASPDYLHDFSYFWTLGYPSKYCCNSPLNEGLPEPTDECGRYMYEERGCDGQDWTPSAETDNLRFSTNCRAFKGQSGGPYAIDCPGSQPCVVGVISGFAQGESVGVRLHGDLRNFFRDLVCEFDSDFATPEFCE